MIATIDQSDRAARQSGPYPGADLAPLDISALAGPLWTHTRGHPGITVAIIDGPANLKCARLRNARLRQIALPTLPLSAGQNSGHGTRMIAILFQSGSGASGIAPECSGLLLPIFDPDRASLEAPCTQADLAAAIDRGRQEGAQIINVSAGARIDEDPADPVLIEAVRACEEAGILVVAAVGNQGCRCRQVPAELPSVLAVGATDASGAVLPLSNWGEAYSGHGLVAPGERVAADRGDGLLELGTGTSDAAALVSGIAALLLSLQLARTAKAEPLRIRRILLETTVRQPSDDPRALQGRLNPIAALDRLFAETAGTGMVAASAAPGGLSDPATNMPERGDGPERQGDWQISAATLASVYDGVLAEQFGCTRVLRPDGSSHLVSDLLYPLADGRSGITILPVADSGPSLLEDGRPQAGSITVDQALRAACGLAADSPIYALLSYVRPNEHTVPLGQLLNTYKRRLGHQHLGAYIGGGRTSHALPAYRLAEWNKAGDDYLWNVAGRPAHIYAVSMQGADQTLLNRNLQIVDLVLSRGVRVPGETEPLKTRFYNLNTCLQFYRDWLRDADYLQDPEWFTNCADHKALVVNVGLNLPHVPHRFAEVFGGADGNALWEAFLGRFAEHAGRPFGAADSVDFVPLWALEGLSATQVRPPSLVDYHRLEAARRDGEASRYEGPHPLAPGRAMAWPAETLLETIGNVLDTYANVADVGGLLAAETLLGLVPTLASALGAPELALWRALKPIVLVLLEADAMMGKPVPQDTIAQLEKALAVEGGRDEATITPEVIEQRARAAAGSILPPRAVAEIIRGEVSRLFPTVHEALGRPGRSLALFFSTNTPHRIACAARRNPFVQISAVGTAMDISELVRRAPASSDGDEGGAKMRQEEVMSQHQNSGVQPSAAVAAASVQEGTPTPATPGIPPAAPPAPAPAPGEAGPQATAACQCVAGPKQLVYALGRLAYDFPTTSRKDSLQQALPAGSSVEQPQALVDHLDNNQWDASAVQWLLMVENAPVYVVEPQGPFARDAYDLLRRFLREQLTENVERVSIPGVIVGSAQLRVGVTVPTVNPEIRGMFSWTTAALIKRVMETKENQGAASQVAEGVRGFLDRVYYELRNLGQSARDRAINYAATNAFQIERVYESAMRQQLELDSIEVEPNPLARPGSDTWDVKLNFFLPEGPPNAPHRVYRLTVDVTDVVPVMVGEVRAWSAR